MYKLIYTTRSYTSESTSLVPRIALEEIGCPYEVVEVELEPAPPDWYLKVNPHGKIPSLIEEDGEREAQAQAQAQVVYPSAAILLHLADLHPMTGLAPAPGTVERGHCYRELFDMAEMLQSAYMMFFFTQRYSVNIDHVPDIRRKAIEWIGRYTEGLNSRLTGGPYLVGNRYSICDIYVYVLARWYVDVRQRIGGAPLPAFEEFTHLSASCALIEARPAVARSLAADDIDTIASG